MLNLVGDIVQFGGCSVTCCRNMIFWSSHRMLPIYIYTKLDGFSRMRTIVTAVEYPFACNCIFYSGKFNFEVCLHSTLLTVGLSVDGIILLKGILDRLVPTAMWRCSKTFLYCIKAANNHCIKPIHIFVIDHYLLTYLLTYSMEHGASWEANRFCS